MRSKHDGTLAANRPRVAGRSRRRACMRPTRHRHAHVAALLAAALLPPTTTLTAQTTALRCGRLIDGISAEARENVTVIVRDGRVAELRDGTAVPDGVDRALDMRERHLPARPDGPAHAPADQAGRRAGQRTRPLQRGPGPRRPPRRPEDAARGIHHPAQPRRLRYPLRDGVGQALDRGGGASGTAHLRGPARARADRRAQRPQHAGAGRGDPDAHAHGQRRRRDAGDDPRAGQVRGRLDQGDGDGRGHVGGRRPHAHRLRRRGDAGRGRRDAPARGGGSPCTRSAPRASSRRSRRV